MFPERAQDGAPPKDSGQGTVEYALILALIALAVLVALGLLGRQITDFLSDLLTFLQSL